MREWTARAGATRQRCRDEGGRCGGEVRVRAWVRLKQRRRETGEVAPRVQDRRCMLEPHLHTLAALIAAHPDRTLARAGR